MTMSKARQRLVNQVKLALVNLAMNGIEVELVRVHGDLLRDLRKALEDSPHIAVEETFRGQTRALAYYYSPSPNAESFDSHLIVSPTTESAIHACRHLQKKRKHFRVKPVGILIPTGWSKFARNMMEQRGSDGQ